MKRTIGGRVTRNIPGMMDYARLAQLHRPTDPAALQQEVRRLAASQGLTAVDIATALRIDLAQVREMLAATPAEAQELHARAWKVTP